jgi:hypothetical protein
VLAKQVLHQLSYVPVALTIPIAGTDAPTYDARSGPFQGAPAKESAMTDHLLLYGAAPTSP